jgi:hypothetical protein
MFMAHFLLSYHITDISFGLFVFSQARLEPRRRAQGR